ncbi:hypothetical protein Salat_1576600 [Sesamum alatum]|uniref:Uncharacterized protein n=1 Tax=Sesamum alatum TaxID=300844 RepID=A0AAE2CMX3_9LAMI|nr:hypothetical protein Salat_1576600 [Sesamum alatum]
MKKIKGLRMSGVAVFMVMMVAIAFVADADDSAASCVRDCAISCTAFGEVDPFCLKRCEKLCYQSPPRRPELGKEEESIVVTRPPPVYPACLIGCAALCKPPPPPPPSRVQSPLRYLG